MPGKHMSIQTGLVLKDVDIRTETAADAGGLDVGDCMPLALSTWVSAAQSALALSTSAPGSTTLRKQAAIALCYNAHKR